MYALYVSIFFVYVCVYVFVRLFVCLFLCLQICMYVSVSGNIYIHFILCVSKCVFICILCVSFGTFMYQTKRFFFLFIIAFVCNSLCQSHKSLELCSYTYYFVCGYGICLVHLSVCF